MNEFDQLVKELTSDPIKTDYGLELEGMFFTVFDRLTETEPQDLSNRLLDADQDAPDRVKVPLVLFRGLLLSIVLAAAALGWQVPDRLSGAVMWRYGLRSNARGAPSELLPVWLKWCRGPGGAGEGSFR